MSKLTAQSLLEIAGLPVTKSAIRRLTESASKKFYLQYAGGDNHSGPYDTEEEAESAHDKLLQSAKQYKYSDEELNNIRDLKIIKESATLAPYDTLTEATDEVEAVITRLKEFNPDFDNSSHIKHDIATKLQQGWTRLEVYNYLRNMEEVNPDIDEDTALKNMKRVRDAVLKRLGN